MPERAGGWLERAEQGAAIPRLLFHSAGGSSLSTSHLPWLQAPHRPQLLTGAPMPGWELTGLPVICPSEPQVAGKQDPSSFPPSVLCPEKKHSELWKQDTCDKGSCPWRWREECTHVGTSSPLQVQGFQASAEAEAWGHKE